MTADTARALALFKEASPVRQTIIYLSLWSVLPVAGLYATYLAARVGSDFPLADPMLAKFDRMIGFDWLTWAKFVSGHPWLNAILRAAYLSHEYQPFLSVGLLALWTRHRNGELLKAVGLLIVIATIISVFLPSIGPADALGFVTDQRLVIDALRAGSVSMFALPWVGIIAFPSCHTAWAIIFAWVHRGLPSFWPFAALNALMLISVPSCGDHYLVDVFGGVVLAAVCLALIKARSER